MVQYIHTPWRDRAELLKVRRQFYPSPPPPPHSSSFTATIISFHAAGRKEEEETGQRRDAVSRVAMWVQRGSCPHMVESTGLLMAAILDDLQVARNGKGGSGGTSAVRLAYSAAFSRFVTGLLDSHQDKQMKQSMYSIAKTIGLPATFVELRHQCTHEQLPSLLKLRSAAQKSLVWIWDYYWKHLTGDESSGDAGNATGEDTCSEVLLRYLLSEDAAKRKSLETRLKQWNEATLLETLTELGESAEDPRVLLRSLQLSRQILDGKSSLSAASTPGADSASNSRDLGAIQAELQQASNELENIQPVERAQDQEKPLESASQSSGWSRYEGTWKPKPIGVV